MQPTNILTDKRKGPRYNVHWNIAVVFDHSENRPTIHGKTIDLSLSGMAMHLDHNLATKKSVSLLLTPPAETEEAKTQTIEIKARVVYCVHSSSDLMFRVAMEFISFKDNGREVLNARLKRQMPADFNKETFTPSVRVLPP